MSGGQFWSGVDIPDAQAQGDWAAALAQAARGSTDCIASTRHLDAALLNQSSSELRDATAAMGKVNSRLRSLSG